MIELFRTLYILLNAKNKDIQSIEMLSLIYLFNNFLSSRLQGFYWFCEGFLIIFALIGFWQDCCILRSKMPLKVVYFKQVAVL